MSLEHFMTHSRSSINSNCIIIIELPDSIYNLESMLSIGPQTFSL